MTQTLRPTSLAEAREAVLDTAGPMLFRGAGTKLDWGAPARDIAVVIDTTGMTKLLTHDAADATVSVQAGMPLADLQATLAGDGQWLAIDPPHVDDGATVGGIFAAADSGPRRQAYGTMRDLVIGATYVLADGKVGRTGGHVIKNVAGYDMAKLLCGSLGTLALVAELVLRVHPTPTASATLRVPADAESVVRLGTALGAAPVEPSAVDWAEGAMWIRLTGHPDAVQAQAQATRELVDVPDVELLEGDDEHRAWRRLISGQAGGTDVTVVRGSCVPTQVGAAIAALDAAAADAGVATDVQAHVLLGIITARVSGGDAAAHAGCVSAWRERLAPLGGHAVVRSRIDGVADAVDVWGPPPSAIGLMRQVKRQLDPVGRCAPGRFVGGI